MAATPEEKLLRKEKEILSIISFQVEFEQPCGSEKIGTGSTGNFAFQAPPIQEVPCWTSLSQSNLD